MPALNKRLSAYIPRDAYPVLDTLSKVDLMELVWDFALFSVGDSAEDATHNPARVAEILNRADILGGATGTRRAARRVAIKRGVLTD